MNKRSWPMYHLNLLCKFYAILLRFDWLYGKEFELLGLVTWKNFPTKTNI